jgi:rhodanese-related sulfurtransferase
MLLRRIMEDHMVRKEAFLWNALKISGVMSIMVSPLMAQSGNVLITPAETQKLVEKDSTVVLLDVRTPEEFHSATGHLGKAVLIPIQELEERVDELKAYKGRTIVVYCRTGHRSTAGTSILRKHGFTAFNMEGGITRWIAEGLHTVP